MSNGAVFSSDVPQQDAQHGVIGSLPRLPEDERFADDSNEFSSGSRWRETFTSSSSSGLMRSFC